MSQALFAAIASVLAPLAAACAPDGVCVPMTSSIPDPGSLALMLIASTLLLRRWRIR